jgi:molybdopterin-guanine dinucleotide biosynthesis protein B
MSRANVVSVIGFKDSGKTRVVEALVEELTNRGYKVGTLKHTAEDVLLDTPGKDTERHRAAGSEATGILHDKGGALFFDRYMKVREAYEKLGDLDYLVLEGFKTLETTTKILVPRNNDDVEELDNGLGIAIVRIDEREISEDHIPVVEIHDVDKLCDIVEAKTFPLLPGLNCHSCGYPDCKSMGVALLNGEAELKQCVGFQDDFILKVNGRDVSTGFFVRNAMTNVVIGFIKTLKGGEDAHSVDLKFEVKRDE